MKVIVVIALVAAVFANVGFGLSEAEIKSGLKNGLREVKNAFAANGSVEAVLHKWENSTGNFTSKLEEKFNQAFAHGKVEAGNLTAELQEKFKHAVANNGNLTAEFQEKFQQLIASGKEKIGNIENGASNLKEQVSAHLNHVLGKRAAKRKSTAQLVQLRAALHKKDHSQG